MLFNKLTANAWVRNTLWMLLSQGLRLFLQGISFALAAKALGPDQYGAFIGTTALVEILSPFSTLGTGEVMVKQVSRDRTNFARYWGNALWVNFLSAVVLTLLLVSVVPWIMPNQFTPGLLLLAAVTQLLFGKAIDLSGKAYQAVGQFKRMAQLLIVPNILRAIAAVVLFFGIPNPTVFHWFGLSFISLSIAGVAALLAVHFELGAPKFNWRIKRSELLDGGYFAIGLSAQTIYNDIDKIMLVRLSTLEAAGIYAASYRLLDMTFVPLRAVMASSYTRFFQAGKSGIRGSAQVAKKLIPVMAGYGVVGAIALIICAPIVPWILGSEYQASVIALQWLAPILILRALHYIAADTLSGADFQAHRSFAQIGVAIANLGLNLYLIPQFPGEAWKGALFASLLSDGLLMVSLWTIVAVQYRKSLPQVVNS